MSDENDPLPGLDPSKIPQRLFVSQLIFSIFLGLLGFISFCYLRPRYPQIYSLRTLRRSDIESLPKTWFSWAKNLYYINDEEVLALSGLDAYVFLCFFRVSIKIFGVLTIISLVVIGPIRYYVTGHYDHQDDRNLGIKDSDGAPIEEFPSYLWVYAMFTYVFILLSLYYLLKQTKTIITVRQSYLGSQNSITDRTIRIDGIPSGLRTVGGLKKNIENLEIGKVVEISFNRNWDVLDHFFQERRSIIKKLEEAYIEYLGIDMKIYKEKIPQSSISLLPNESKQERPTMRVGFWGLFGAKVDTINYYLLQLKKIDFDISKLREDTSKFKITDSAFVTMDSVASAQMIAQAVLDPKVHHLISTLAPSPSDVIWENFGVQPVKRFIHNYAITILFVISSVVLIFPVSSLAAFINIETITKFWPSLGHMISESKWLTTLVTGILPPTLFTLLNAGIPYLYSFLSTKQYFYSHGDVELASVSKNFFYTFFNLFLVFTIAGSASNYWSYFTDTTKIAFQLANSIKKLSLFYTDLILLQGLGIFPYKLMQFGDVFIIGYYNILRRINKSKVGIRKLRYLYYSPKIFDFGLILPQHILIFVITMIYSIVSAKLLTSGLIYFVLGYYVYKYQLIYSMIHPQHSTGKVWAMIIHRLTIGLILFELTMIGTLALENAVFLSVSLLPLIGVTIYFHFTFEKYYKPLLHYIALRAIKSPSNKRLYSGGNSANPDNSSAIADVSASTIDAADSDTVSIDSLETSRILNNVRQYLRKRRNTFDERKDLDQTYVYPNTTSSLDGPWVGFYGNQVEIINHSQCDSHSLLNMNEDVEVDVRKINIDTINDKISTEYAGELVTKKQIKVHEWE